MLDPPLPSDASHEIGERIARLCAAYDDGQLAEVAEEAGAASLLGSIVAQVRSGRFEAAELGQLLDRLDDALAAESIHGLTRPDRQWAPVSGLTRSEYAWFCPLRRCVRADEAPASFCAIGGVAFVRSPVWS